jgi:hypothetical protein
MNKQRHTAIKNRNKTIRSCIAMLKISMQRIEQQGTGCSIPHHGSAYKHGSKRDAIAILVDASFIRNYWFEVISAESMRPLVNKLADKFSARIDTSATRTVFVEFLTRLQDAHDAAFDFYDKQEGNEMQNFKVLCSNINDWLESEITNEN